MRKAVSSLQSFSGRRPKRRVADVEAVLKVLRSAGLDATAAATTSSAGTSEQARQAIAEGCDTIFACGGDGTIHDVLQALVGTQVALGIIPLGTANTLRPRSSHSAVCRTGGPCGSCVPAPARRCGKNCFPGLFPASPAFRYFTVTAGVGVDAHLFYKLNVLIKGRLGMLAYYLKATRLVAHPRYANVQGEMSAAEGGTSKDQFRWNRSRSSWLSASHNLAACCRELAPGASLARNDLRLVLFKTQNRLLYLAYILRGLFGRDGPYPGHRIGRRTESYVHCTIVLGKRNQGFL